MEKTIDGVEYDTENAEVIANHDAEDCKTAAELYRTKEGKYFLYTEKSQVRRRGIWRDHPMDGTAASLPKNSRRFLETIVPLSKREAIDWVVATLVPKCLATVIQEQLGYPGELADRGRYAIQAIQLGLAAQYGTSVNTDTGRATLSIAYDRVELTDDEGSIIASDAESALGKLIVDSSSRENIAVTLDRLSTKLVRWYAEENDRDIEDVVNGVVGGQMGHLRSELEDEIHDDSPIHMADYLMEAIHRRRLVEAKAKAV